MKELTIEQKAQAYDDAIRKAKIALDCCDSDSTITKQTIYDIFPELAESEDEKIRKALLNLVHNTTGDELWDNYDVRKEKALAWLERQGEQILADSAKTCKDEQVTFTCIDKKVTMSVQELINYYIDNECANTAEECNF